MKNKKKKVLYWEKHSTIDLDNRATIGIFKLMSTELFAIPLKGESILRTRKM